MRTQVLSAGLKRAGLLSVMLATAMVGAGCEVDSFMDQSVVGRWEYTPTIAPILERIDVIEGDSGEFVETTAVLPEDLIPQVEDYQVGPGDGLYIEIFDFLQQGVATPFERLVDSRGDIDLPQLGRVEVMDLSADQVRDRIRQRLSEDGIIEDALVSVQITAQRQSTYAIFGQVGGVGRYVIPEPDYRLLEAITEAGGISEGSRYIYVIRQAPLSDEASRGRGARPRENVTDQQQPEGVDLNELIEELGGEGDGGGMAMFAQDAQQQPPIDLPADAPQRPTSAEGGAWIFVDGRWVQVDRSAAQRGIPEGADPLSGTDTSDLVTQRVIQVPVRPLLAGAAEYNIVIRPGDIIRVPGPDQGFVYLAGVGVARPGVYGLPSYGRLTLSKAILSAGGLTGIAVPKRVDLTRMVGDTKQATIRLNLKAIAEGTQPDIFLKSDDMINVGTNFWATPVAIIRSGFRASYGFGFLLDRNFGNDVFGAPPTNIGGR